MLVIANNSGNLIHKIYKSIVQNVELMVIFPEIAQISNNKKNRRMRKVMKMRYGGLLIFFLRNNDGISFFSY